MRLWWRRTAAKRFDREPSSPCVKVCKFSAGGDFCIGCRRTRDEIATWWRLTDVEKRELRERLKNRTPGNPFPE